MWVEDEADVKEKDGESLKGDGEVIEDEEESEDEQSPSPKPQTQSSCNPGKI